MNEQFVLKFVTDAIYTTLIVAGPILVVTLIVGLMVGIFQAVTSINEMTLTFIPKILVGGEVLTGITIGMIINFLFAGIELAGEYVGVDMGFAMAREFDPLFRQQVSVIARLNNILAMLIFVLINGHHFLIEAVVYSFKLLPIGTWSINHLAIDKIMKISASVFVIGVKIAAPAIVTLFLTSVAMGITARAVPQMNIFFVGFPLRISAGLISLIMAFPLFFYVFKQLLSGFESDIMYLLKVM